MAKKKYYAAEMRKAVYDRDLSSIEPLIEKGVRPAETDDWEQLNRLPGALLSKAMT
jgi:hypothetical protein